MRPTTILALSAGLLIACGPRSGGGERSSTAGARDPGQAEARSGAPGQPAAEPVPFGPRSEARRGQDSVLRMTGSRQRQKVRPDSTYPPDPSMAR
jgi:hypothetical protein